MKRILVCTDGSPYAASVYDHAVWAATRSQAAVHVLHMLERNLERADFTDLSGVIGPDSAERLLAELVKVEEERNRLMMERGKAILEGALRHLSEAGVREVTVEQQQGELIEAVNGAEEDFDLVVIGKRGESARFARMHLGSNLERVIRASTRPVLVASRKFEPIRRFMVAWDGGPSARRAVEFACRHPLLAGLECLLLRTGKIDAAAEESAHEAADQLRTAGYAVSVAILPGEPERIIAETVASRGIDLLVMGAYGHRRIRQLIVGSTTTATVRTCPIPILMLR